jgi:signal peptidase II
MILIGISILVVVLDQFTKFLVLHSLYPHESVPLLSNIIYLTYTQNSGSAFGLFSNLGSMIRIPFFIAVTLASTFIVYAYQRMISEEKQMTRMALGLVWGGALGNMVDRLLYGQVIDFIDVRYNDIPWYVFNVADSCISIGILFLLFEFIRGNWRKTQA